MSKIAVILKNALYRQSCCHLSRLSLFELKNCEI